ncbi:MAG TPA: BlaI/MecI/CopY family transcriptional regulator [Phycisphaerae bacterium]|nr:BlaI/MecI/CopY family transcriptional regulator [Phycisphaerae bacterium]
MPAPRPHFSRRERQIMDILFARGEASAADVQAALPDAPGYSAVRALLRILEEKGHVRHREEQGKYIFSPTVSRTRAAQSALRRLLDTFFAGSLEEAISTHLTDPKTRLSPEQLKRLTALIEQAKTRGE